MCRRESLLFWTNTFVFTYHQFDVDLETGERIEAKNPHCPFITWTIQDELLDQFEFCLKNGRDILIDKTRDMGGYKTLSEINSYIDGIIDDHPTIISTKQGIGQSIEGRDIYFVKISDNPGIDEDEPEIQISVDREKAASFKLSIKDIADSVKTSMEGDVATKYHDADQEVDILVRLQDRYRNDIPNLERILIHTPLNSDIPLKEVAGISHAERLGRIQRRDLNRVSVISANISGVRFSECLEEVKTRLAGISLPPDYIVAISDEQEEMNRSFRNLRFALGLSILLVYMLLASLFESFLYPFIIMFAVPLAAVGVILILFLTGNPMSLGVYIGGIMLGGIVVNNSIILVDYINTLRKNGVSQQEAVVEGGKARLRPILMTALTTILGLVPLAIGLGSGAEIRSPLALTVIGGLTTSTFMTLIVIPIAYSLTEDIRSRVSG